MPLAQSTKVQALAGVILLSLAAFFLYTWHNDFLYFYHTDEPGKVTQVMSGERKFNHPLLLLTASELLARAGGGIDSPQAVVLSGRYVSATAAAIAVGLLTALGIRLFGMAGGFLLGAVVVSNPLLFELTHYMKEDCCLLVGLAAFFLTLAHYERRTTLTAAALVGAACGLAISGKYIGSVSLAVAVVAVFFLAPGLSFRARMARLGMLLVGAAAAFLVFNFQAVMNLSFLGSGVEKELIYMGKHSEGVLFQNKIFKSIPEVASSPLIILAGLGLLDVAWRLRRGAARVLWVYLGFASIYLLCIHLTPLARERYLLPVVIVFCIFATSGVCAILRWPGIWTKLAAVAGSVLLLLPNVLATGHLLSELRTDSRRDVATWIARNVPLSAVFAVDDRSHFREYWAVENVPRKLPIVLRTNQESVTLESPAEFRKQGITHVLVTEDTHQAITRRAKKDPAWNAVIEQIFPERGLLWQSPKRDLRYIHPGLRLYVLPAS